MLQRVAACCSVLQRVAVFCSMTQTLAARHIGCEFVDSIAEML